MVKDSENSSRRFFIFCFTIKLSLIKYSKNQAVDNSKKPIRVKEVYCKEKAPPSPDRFRDKRSAFIVLLSIYFYLLNY